MAKARDPKRNRDGRPDNGWRILPFTDGTPAGPPNDGAESPIDEEAMLAQMKEFAEARPELFAEAMGAMREMQEAFVKRHGREPTEEEILDLLGLGDMDEEDMERIAGELDAAGAFDNLLDDIDDEDLEPFPAEDRDDDGGKGDP